MKFFLALIVYRLLCGFLAAAPVALGMGIVWAAVTATGGPTGFALFLIVVSWKFWDGWDAATKEIKELKPNN